MNYTTILTSKGTTTIPAEIRQALGLKPGMQVTFASGGKSGEYVLRRTQTLAEVQAQNLAHIKKHNIKPVTIEEMRALREDFWSDRADSAKP